MTLKEAIVSLPWQEVDVRKILIDCINGIWSHLGLILIIIFTVIILIEAAEYAANLSGLFSRHLTARYKKPKWYKYELALPTDHNVTPFLTRLGYLFGGTIIIILSYALALLEVNLILNGESTYAPPVINDTGDAAATIRHYMNVLRSCFGHFAHFSWPCCHDFCFWWPLV